jgi:hypothetical protein
MTYSRRKATTIGRTGLASVFGMGTGVSPYVWSPGRSLSPMLSCESKNGGQIRNPNTYLLVLSEVEGSKLETNPIFMHRASLEYADADMSTIRRSSPVTRDSKKPMTSERRVTRDERRLSCQSMIDMAK